MRTLRGFWAAIAPVAGLATAVVCLWGHDSYVIGSLWWALRWLVGLAMVLSLVRAWRRGSRTAVALSITTLGLIVTEGSLRFVSRARPDDTVHTPLRVATHNILFQGNALEASLEALRGTDAELIALQEVTPGDAARLVAQLGADFPHHAEAPHVGAHGYALFSRYPLDDVTLVRFPGKLPFAQCATVRLPDGPLPTCNVHLSAPVKELGDLHSRWPDPQGLERNAERRRREWRAVEAELERRGGQARALALGDFNSLEVEPLYGEVRAHFVDAFRQTRLSWGATWPHLASTPPFARIDYVFTRGALAPRHAEVVRASGSDHLAVAAVLAR
jgi:vancomycin resistance protein VanJ